ncbi:MAG: phosphate ABC transporter, permease protein PstA, partial [Erysipelotrichaceae bacterium]
MRKYDKFLNLLTYLSSFVSIFVLGSILVFLFSNGIGMINLDLLTSNYWSENFLGSVDATVISEFENTGDYENFSTKWGVALTDYVNASSAQQVVIEYIDPDSPFQY